MSSRIGILLSGTLLLGCGGMTPTGGPPSNAALSGSWHAILTSATPGDSPTLDLFVIQNGETLWSDRVALRTTCSSVGTMSGSVNGNQVNMLVTGNNGDTVNVIGTASVGSFSGNYTSKTSGCGVNGETGTLSAERIPPVQSASWTGSTQSTRYTGNTTFTANLSEDSSGNVTGRLTFTASTGASASCPPLVGTNSIAATQTGSQMGFSDNQADGLSGFVTMNSTANNLTGSYGVSICNGDEGVFTMSRP
jgi:hypothetical protein